MSIKTNHTKIILYFLLAVFAFQVNYFYANIGLYPIDSFSFFDTGYLITKGHHPIKDYWVISGILIDYLQSLFFKLFGPSWKAYIYHASTLNVFVSLLFFFFLNKFIKNLTFNFVLSLSLSILCYPVAGTPFPYQHALILSYASIIIFYLAIYENKKVYWQVLPTLMIASFLSMQLPSGLINLLLIFFIIFYFFLIDKKFLKDLLIGFTYSLIIIIFYFSFVGVSIKDFFIQIILFPLDFGTARIVGEESAYTSANLLNKFTFRGVIGHFKFINFFIF